MLYLSPLLLFFSLLWTEIKMRHYCNTHDWHHLFSPYFLKPSIMPNQGNKSNGKSGARPKKNSTMPSTQKQGTASATKHSRGDNGQSAAGSDSKGGSKKISDGEGNV
jgi:hypothetical protein